VTLSGSDRADFSRAIVAESRAPFAALRVTERRDRAARRTFAPQMSLTLTLSRRTGEEIRDDFSRATDAAP
jgi:hypothetical protein